jgi:hypothetical protein
MMQEGGKGFVAGTQIFLVTLLDMYCLLLNSFNFLFGNMYVLLREKGKGHGEREEQNLQCCQRL